jgi:signal transduction histidine kinase
MKKIALVFVSAVFVPSLVLAWLAVRSLQDQQFLLERQQSLLCQGVADAIAAQVQEVVVDCQQTFNFKVGALIDGHNPRDIARSFDELLCQEWPLAQAGFAVTTSGDVLSPSPQGRPAARKFFVANGGFLANRESAEVYWNPREQNFAQRNYLNANQEVSQQRQQSEQQGPEVGSALAANTLGQPVSQAQNDLNTGLNRVAATNTRPEFRSVVPQQQAVMPISNLKEIRQTANRAPAPPLAAPGQPSMQADGNDTRLVPGGNAMTRSVSPQQGGFGNFSVAVGNSAYPEDNTVHTSKVAASPAEFRQLIGDDLEGALARFVDNRLNVLFWRRPPEDPGLVFGAQLALARLEDELRPVIEHVESSLGGDICVALLDDTAKPVAQSRPGFRGNWKRPFVATEIGEVLPHWEVGVYLLDPNKLTRSAEALKLTLGLLIALLLAAIGVGSWLIVADLNRQLTLARQKTDFVSNVSHELKTPLTSIRMFSELLAEGRVADPAKQRSYLGIITAETARLTRLINNVLDFARIERGEKKYHFQPCDLVSVAREAGESYRPHLEANGFRFECELPPSPVWVNGDRDALAQVIVNLLSNAEKYSAERKEVGLRVEAQGRPLPYVEAKVLDRGLGVPRGSEEKIFEKFYRAHDSLSSGIQGSGLGLTLARQIARAHGGEVVYEPRETGGSCFSLRLPVRPGGPGPSPQSDENANSDCRG